MPNKKHRQNASYFKRIQKLLQTITTATLPTRPKASREHEHHTQGGSFDSTPTSPSSRKIHRSVFIHVQIATKELTDIKGGRWKWVDRPLFFCLWGAALSLNGGLWLVPGSPYPFLEFHNHIPPYFTYVSFSFIWMKLDANRWKWPERVTDLWGPVLVDRK